jgi:hypothetical protein
MFNSLPTYERTALGPTYRSSIQNGAENCVTAKERQREKESGEYENEI